MMNGMDSRRVGRRTVLKGVGGCGGRGGWDRRWALGLDLEWRGLAPALGGIFFDQLGYQPGRGEGGDAGGSGGWDRGFARCVSGDGG